jgi:Zn-dependent peptidase ImmA (M78 family)/DNA-binding XRE family transcriptional regulator
MSTVLNGDRVRLARLFKGYTLQDLGDAVHVSRQSISQLENGKRTPGSDVLSALAEYLEVGVGFFYSSIDSDVKMEQCHFRKRKTTPIGIANRVLAFGTLFEQLVLMLNEYLDLPMVDFHFIEDLDFDTSELSPLVIEKLAECCRERWKIGTDNPIDNMIRVLENAGAVVTYFNGVSDKVDALSMNKKIPIVVRNTAKESICRMRFDLAHELGHFIMHDGIVTGNPKTEKEADMFASAFLMPRNAFAKEFRSCLRGNSFNWPKIYELKIRWKVSVRAIIYRANFLGLISAQQYRSANVWLNKSGQTKHEHHDDKIPTESPEVLESSLNILDEHLGVTFKNVAHKLGVTVKLLSQLTGVEYVENQSTSNVVPLHF